MTPRAQVVRVVFSNCGPSWLLDQLNMPATAWPVEGLDKGAEFSESGAIVECSTRAVDEVRQKVADILAALGEQAAYVTIDGKGPRLWSADGKETML